MSEDQAIVKKDDLNEYVLQAKDIDNFGTIRELSAPLPDHSRFDDWPLKLRVLYLKLGAWSKQSYLEIVQGIMYSERNRLDILRGEVYPTGQGRIGVNADAIIGHAQNSGRLRGYTVEITDGPPITFSKPGEKSWSGLDYHAKVTTHVKDFEAPVVFETDLHEWFVGTNPNWHTRTKFMFRKRALAKALGEIVPLGFDPDEAPPVEVSTEIVDKVREGKK